MYFACKLKQSKNDTISFMLLIIISGLNSLLINEILERSCPDYKLGIFTLFVLFYIILYLFLCKCIVWKS
jgi:hypothetical protein